MHTLFRILASISTGSMNVARWTFNGVLALFIPFIILGSLAWVTDSSGTLFWAALSVRLAQAALFGICLLSVITLILSFGALIAAGFTARALGHEDFSNFSL